MAHFPDTGRTWSFGEVGLVGTALGDLDAKALKTINGVTGDAGVAGAISTPVIPISILGAGMALQSPATWSSAQTNLRRISPLRYYSNQGNWSVTAASDRGVKAMAAAQQLVIPISPDVIDGAIITRFRAWFRVDAAKAALPVNYPIIFLSRHNLVTGEVSAIPFTTSNNRFNPAPANVAAYINGGTPNLISCIPDNSAGAALIDLGTHAYFIVYEDDDQAAAPYNVVTGFELLFGSVTNQGQP